MLRYGLECITRFLRIIAICVMAGLMMLFALSFGPFPRHTAASIFERIFYADKSIEQYDRNEIDYDSREITINGYRMTVKGGKTEDDIQDVITYYKRYYSDQKPYMIDLSHPNLGIFAVLDRGPDPDIILDESTIQRFLETGLVGDLGGVVKALVAFRDEYSTKTEIITATLDEDFNLFNLFPEHDQPVPGTNLKDIPGCGGIRTFSFDMEDETAGVQFQQFKSYENFHTVKDCYIRGMISAGWNYSDIIQSLLEKRSEIRDMDLLVFQKHARFCYIVLAYEQKDRSVTSCILTR
jgi:hypothetical protein